MGIRVVWDNPEQTVYRFDFDTSWAWEDMHRAVAESRRLAASVSHRVDVIINLPPNTVIPKGNSIQHMQRVMQGLPANVGLMVLVGGSMFVSSLISIAARIYRGKFAATHTLDEARAIIEQAKQGGHETVA